MAIIMISGPPYCGREELAASLAPKTGWPVLSRDELVDLARERGIKTGRLEVSIIKTPGLSEKLAREKDLYLALLTSSLCERAREGNLIYHGRAGHLLLPGVTHRLRVGLTAPREFRIKKAAKALKLGPDKAAAYLDQVDRDIEKWIRFVHRVDGREIGQYDLFLNLQNVAAENAAVVLCDMAELPDFRPTPVGLKLMSDLNLGAQAKLRLAFDPRTAELDLGVRADDGVVTVTYLPRQEDAAGDIPRVLADLEGCSQVHCTMAETSILWVQEAFSPDSENFKHIIQLSQRWGAAVELLRLIPPGEGEAEDGLSSRRDQTTLACRTGGAYDGGIEDDGPGSPEEDEGLVRTEEELVTLGRSAGSRGVCGGAEKILETAKENGSYSLVVIGDMFLSKGHSARTRQTRELALAIRDRLKAPVITADELETRFLFGPKQGVKLVVFLALTIMIYAAVFSWQGPILDFLGGELHAKMAWLTSLGVVIFVPLVAYVYGAVTGLLLKLINMD
ncbi:MAG: cytidylate kinase-like family protein [Pseudomonadota bacterium]